MNEHKDAHFKATSLAILGLLVMLIIGIVFVRTVYHSSLEAELNGQLKSEQKIFPQPQPGHFTAESLAALRAQETRELTTFKWADEKHAEAQVSIERAIEIYEAQHAE